MDDDSLEKARAHYDDVLISHLHRYQERAMPYGRLRERPCGHVCWDLVRDLPCIACAGTRLDKAAWHSIKAELHETLALAGFEPESTLTTAAKVHHDRGDDR